MTPPDPQEDPDVLRSLIERGSQVRELDARQRAILLARFRQRTSSAEAPPRRAGAALGLALGALGALGGVAALRLSDDLDHAPSSPRAASSAQPQAKRATAAQHARAADARHLSMGGRGEIVLDGDAVARLPEGLANGATGPLKVTLERGRMTASVAPRRRDEPLSIVTPHVAVVVIGTRFTVAVEGDRTQVAVEHGRVRVDRGDRSVFVDGGSALQSDDPRLTPPAEEPAAVVASSAPCADVPHRTRCLRDIARGRGLAAENALFALALYEHDERHDADAALTLLRAYTRRFPRGVLFPDAVRTAARILHAQGRESEACRLLARHARKLPLQPPDAAWLPVDCTASEARRRGEAAPRARAATH